MVALLALAGIGAVFQQVAERRDATAHPPPGQLVDVGADRRVHAQLSGEEHDGPTVVLDAGLTAFSPVWGWVQDGLSEHVTVVSYDRAGLGWSDPADDVSPETLLADLDATLAGLELDEPFVLVGHSFGGLLARAFAADHPDKVAGLVLVDPGHEEADEALGEAYAQQRESNARLLPVVEAARRIGLLRLFHPMTQGLDTLPGELDGPRSRMYTGDYLQALRQELAALDEVFEAVAAAPDDHGDLPVRVLSAADPEEGQPFAQDDLHELHQGLRSLSSEATHHVVDDADHLSVLTDPAAAAEVTHHVLEVVEQTAPR